MEKNQRLSFDMPADQHKYLRMYCFKTGVSLKDFILDSIFKTILHNQDEELTKNQNQEEQEIFNKILQSQKKKQVEKNAVEEIRKTLVGIFPNTVFSISVEEPDYIMVFWRDGPIHKEVFEVVKKYRHTIKNAEGESKEFNNLRNDIPQVKTVSACRDYSEEVEEKFIKELLEKNDEFKKLSDYKRRSFISDMLRDVDLTQIEAK